MLHQLLEKNKEELIDKILEQEKEIERLKKELRKYKNPNTPPSAHPLLKPVTAPVSNRPRGAPRGHRGTTRPWIPATVIEHITADHCPLCQSEDITVTGHQDQQIEDIPIPVAPVVRTIER